MIVLFRTSRRGEQFVGQLHETTEGILYIERLPDKKWFNLPEGSPLVKEAKWSSKGYVEA